MEAYLNEVVRQARLWYPGRRSDAPTTNTAGPSGSSTSHAPATYVTTQATTQPTASAAPAPTPQVRGLPMTAIPSHGGVTIAPTPIGGGGSTPASAFFPPFQPVMTATSRAAGPVSRQTVWPVPSTPTVAQAAASPAPTPASYQPYVAPVSNANYGYGHVHQGSRPAGQAPTPGSGFGGGGEAPLVSSGGAAPGGFRMGGIPNELRNAVKVIVPFHSESASSERAAAFWRSFEARTEGMDDALRLTAFEQCRKGKVGQEWWYNSKIVNFETLKVRFHNRFVSRTPAQMWHQLRTAKRNYGESVEEWGDRIGRMCEALQYNEPRMRFEFFADGIRNKQLWTMLNASVVASIDEACSLLLFMGLDRPVEEEDEFAEGGKVAAGGKSTQDQVLEEMQQMRTMLRQIQQTPAPLPVAPRSPRRPSINAVSASTTVSNASNGGGNGTPQLNIRMGPETRTQEGETVCGRCGRRSCSRLTCPRAKGTCNRSDQYGHYSMECYLPSTPTNGTRGGGDRQQGFRPRACNLCDSTEHFMSKCPWKKRLKEMMERASERGAETPGPGRVVASVVQTDERRGAPQNEGSTTRDGEGDVRAQDELKDIARDETEEEAGAALRGAPTEEDKGMDTDEDSATDLVVMKVTADGRVTGSARKKMDAETARKYAVMVGKGYAPGARERSVVDDDEDSLNGVRESAVAGDAVEAEGATESPEADRDEDVASGRQTGRLPCEVDAGEGAPRGEIEDAECAWKERISSVTEADPTDELEARVREEEEGGAPPTTSTKGRASQARHGRLFTDRELELLEQGEYKLASDEPEEYAKELEERLFPRDEVELRQRMQGNAARQKTMNIEEMSRMLGIPVEKLERTKEVCRGAVSTPEYWLEWYEKTLAVSSEANRANRDFKGQGPCERPEANSTGPSAAVADSPTPREGVVEATNATTQVSGGSEQRTIETARNRGKDEAAVEQEVARNVCSSLAANGAASEIETKGERDRGDKTVPYNSRSVIRKVVHRRLRKLVGDGGCGADEKVPPFRDKDDLAEDEKGWLRERLRVSFKGVEEGRLRVLVGWAEDYYDKEAAAISEKLKLRAKRGVAETRVGKDSAPSKAKKHVSFAVDGTVCAVSGPPERAKALGEETPHCVHVASAHESGRTESSDGAVLGARAPAVPFVVGAGRAVPVLAGAEVSAALVPAIDEEAAAPDTPAGEGPAPVCGVTLAGPSGGPPPASAEPPCARKLRKLSNARRPSRVSSRFGRPIPASPCSRLGLLSDSPTGFSSVGTFASPDSACPALGSSATGFSALGTDTSGPESSSSSSPPNTS